MPYANRNTDSDRFNLLKRPQSSSARRLHPSLKESAVTGGCVPFVSGFMEKGYVKIWRKLRHNPIATDPYACHLFLRLLIDCEWNQQKTVFFKGKPRILKPGQLSKGRYQLSEETGIPASSVRNTLKRLKSKYQILDLETDSRWTIITLLNWDTYQNDKIKKDYKKDSVRTASGQQVDTLEEYKNIRSKEYIYTQPFETFWKVYPARNGKKLLKQEAFKKFTLLTEEEVLKVQVAAQNYAESKVVKDGYAKDAVRFLKNDYWKDWLMPEQVEEEKEGKRSNGWV